MGDACYTHLGKCPRCGMYDIIISISGDDLSFKCWNEECEWHSRGFITLNEVTLQYLYSYAHELLLNENLYKEV